MIAECVEWVRRTLSLVVVGCMGAGMPMFAQTATAGAKAFTFDVVSIHPTNPDSQMTRVLILSDRFSANGVSMMSLISFAYPVENSNQISGVSGSIGSARFDVEAKMDEDTVAALKNFRMRSDRRRDG
jgi:Protein of unknown function (DUF3738)